MLLANKPHATEPRCGKALALAALLALLLPATPAPGPAPAEDYEAATTGNTPDAVAHPADARPDVERVRHLAGLGAARWHAQGQRGRGVTVAVLDTGFRGYRQHLGKALPARVRVRSFRDDGDLEARDSQHGILCGEVVHAVAPEAELLFANWEPDRPDRFLDAVRWARSAGAQVISCSIIMPSWSDGEGNGPVHAELANLLGKGDRPGDMLCFASAGNTAQRHWSGSFRDGGDGYHTWAPGQTVNLVTPWSGERVSVELCAVAGASLVLSVHDAVTAQEVGRSPLRCATERSCAVVRFLPKPGHTYEVRVRREGGRPALFHLVVLGGGLRYAKARGSVCFPGDGPAVVALGAVEGEGRRASYSSCGPNSCAPKPDLVASVPFPSLWRPRPFSGTSAAAPQAAALAALVWSRHPDWTAARVRDALREAARDLGPPGHDHETGYGLVCLP
jgi:hypothetical protein